MCNSPVSPAIRFRDECTRPQQCTSRVLPRRPPSAEARSAQATTRPWRGPPAPTAQARAGSVPLSLTRRAVALSTTAQLPRMVSRHARTRMDGGAAAVVCASSRNHWAAVVLCGGWSDVLCWGSVDCGEVSTHAEVRCLSTRAGGGGGGGGSKRDGWAVCVAVLRAVRFWRGRHA